ncbi:MAG: fatty acid desaturase family protein [Flavobacteriales bacterium]|nr:fatty acid desaturase family protein [Flavobacteriales bacterium]
MSVNQFVWYNARVKEIFTPDEIKQLTKRNDWLGAWQIINTWLWIGAAFTLVYFFIHPITIFIALWILGGKQLACAIILHDASHYSLFKNPRINTVIGNIFGGWPIFHNVEQYRPYHLLHHKTTGTDEDPDLNLTKGYPASKQSMIRKFLRDLTGITGLKAMIGLLAMHIGLIEYNLGNRIIKQPFPGIKKIFSLSIKNLSGPIISNAILFTFCWISGKPLLYLLWPAANIFTYPFCIRVRSIAEHSVVEDRLDPHVNSRTIRANLFEQLLFAPLHVNYHAEHHLHMSVPSYRFKKMHQLLRERGYFDRAPYANGYWEIIRLAVKKEN